MASKKAKKAVVVEVAAPKKALADRAKERAAREFSHFCGGVVVAVVVLCGVYRFCDKVVAVTDKAIRFVAEHEASAEIIPAGITFAPGYESAPPMEFPDRSDIRALAEDSGRAWDVDPLLLLSIAFTESSGNVLATNGNTRGLMQFTKDTRNRLHISEDEAHDTRSALEHAAYLISLKRKEQRGDMTRAVESYRCGNSTYDAQTREGCIGSPMAKAYRQRVGKYYQELVRSQLR